jgi:hypothetical protein
VRSCLLDAGSARRGRRSGRPEDVSSLIRAIFGRGLYTGILRTGANSELEADRDREHWLDGKLQLPIRTMMSNGDMFRRPPT